MELVNNVYIDVGTILCGDFNAHTYIDCDYVDLDDELIDDIEIASVPVVLENCNMSHMRCNQDKIRKNLFGEKLLQLCRALGIVILNGRTQGDKHGTCTTNKGTVVDYILCNCNVLPFIQT